MCKKTTILILIYIKGLGWAFLFNIICYYVKEKCPPSSSDIYENENARKAEGDEHDENENDV